MTGLVWTVEAIVIATVALLWMVAVQIANDRPAPPRPNMIWVPIDPEHTVSDLSRVGPKVASYGPPQWEYPPVIGQPVLVGAR